MAIDHKRPVVATSSQEHQVPNDHQHIKNRGRSNSPPLSRAVFYNPDAKTTQIRRGKDIGQPILSLKNHSLHRTHIISIDLGKWEKIKIPAQNRLVTIFVDAETESKPTIHSAAQDGRSNVVLTRLQMDRVGLYGQFLRRVGLLKTCYVRNAPPVSETSSQSEVNGVKAC